MEGEVEDDGNAKAFFDGHDGDVFFVVIMMMMMETMLQLRS